MDEKWFYGVIGAAVPVILGGVGWLIKGLVGYYWHRKEQVQNHPKRTLRFIEKPGNWCHWFYSAHRTEDGPVKVVVHMRFWVFITNMTKGDVTLVNAYIKELDRYESISVRPRNEPSSPDELVRDTETIPAGQTYTGTLDFTLTDATLLPGQSLDFTIVVSDQFSNRHKLRRTFNYKPDQYTLKLSPPSTLSRPGEFKITEHRIGGWRKRTVRKLSGVLLFCNNSPKHVLGLVAVKFSGPIKPFIPKVEVYNSLLPPQQGVPPGKSGTIHFETEITGELDATDVTIVDHMNNEYSREGVKVKKVEEKKQDHGGRAIAS